MKTITLENVRQAARRIIAEVPESDDVAIVRTVGAQVDPEVVNLDGRDLAARVLKAIVPPIPKEPCPCAEAKALDARVDAARSKLASTIAEIKADREECARREADRAERERIERDREELRRVQAELDRAHSIRLAKLDYARGLADSERYAHEKADADQSLAEFRIALRDMHRTDNRRPEDIARERAERDPKRWRGGR